MEALAQILSADFIEDFGRRHWHTSWVRGKNLVHILSSEFGTALGCSVWHASCIKTLLQHFGEDFGADLECRLCCSSWENTLTQILSLGEDFGIDFWRILCNLSWLQTLLQLLISYFGMILELGVDFGVDLEHRFCHISRAQTLAHILSSNFVTSLGWRLWHGSWVWILMQLFGQRL